MLKHLFNRLTEPTASALFKTMEQNDPVALLRLLKKGGDVNARAPERGLFKKLVYDTPYAPQSTLLHLAALAGNQASVRLLIRYGADVNAVNAEGQSPIDYAVTNLSYYEAKKKAPGLLKHVPFTHRAEKLQNTIDSYNGIVEDLLKAGATPGLFQIPARFMPKPPSR